MQATAISANWITDRRYDLLWYIAPAFCAYLLMFLGLGPMGDLHGVMLLWMLWVVVVDGPHIFGTISRTYFDAEEWRTRRRLLLGSLIWFLPGPLAVALGITSGSRQPYLMFLLFANVWAYWHVVRQHYGFLALYQRKNGEAAGKENPVDYWVYYTLMMAPLLSFVLLNSQAREAAFLGAGRGSIEAGILNVVRGVVAGAAVVYVWKEWRRWRSGEAWNVPKNLFLLAVVPVHVIVCMVPAIATNLHLLLFTALVTFHHGVQYHGIIWFHNKNRYGGEEARERHGLASWFGRSFLIYYAAGLAFTALVRYSSWWFTGMENVPLGPGPTAISQTAIGAEFTVAELAVAFWWGFALHHYYLDQRIWRVSRDKRLRSDLKVA